MSQAILKFVHETSDFKATVILKQEKQMKFIVESKNGNKTKYGTNFLIDGTPKQIDNLIQSGLIDNIKDFYVVLLGVKNSLRFVEENRLLKVWLSFCHRQCTMEIPLDDISQDPEDEDEQKAVSINNLELPQQLNEEQNQIKKNNGEMYYVNEYTDDGQYQGQMLNGLKHGKGKFFFANGDLYTGQYFEDRRHGYGQYLYNDGEKYEGNFINDQLYGRGKYYLKNRQMESFYMMGLANGPGIQTSINGDISVGIHRNGQIDGKTLSFLANGDIIEFDQLTSQSHGYAKYYSTDGQIFEGLYQGGKKQGVGTYYWMDGSKQEGNYRNDLKHGEFVMTNGNTGEVTKSYWFNGESCSQDQFNLKSIAENASPAPLSIDEIDQEHLDEKDPGAGN